MRTILQHEIDRRGLMAEADARLVATMEQFTKDTDGLTPLEWLQVIGECQSRICRHGLRDEWNEGE